MRVAVLPLLGPLHLRSPHYNAVTVRDTLAALEPHAVAATPLAPDWRNDPSWRDTPEITLPLAIEPWTERRNMPLHGILEPSPDPQAARDFERYLDQYDKGRATLAPVHAARRDLADALERPWTLPTIERELLPLVRTYTNARRDALGDGPGTDWLLERAHAMAARVLEHPGAHDDARIVVLADLETTPLLRDALASRTDPLEVPAVPPSDDAAARALLDLAFRGDTNDPSALLGRLRDLGTPEARYHEANLLLANGHPFEALETLKAASREDFQHPYYLPGFLLARLGQLQDLAGERDAAKRAYRGVLALDWAPEDARDAAHQGLQAPFEPPRPDTEPNETTDGSEDA